MDRTEFDAMANRDGYDRVARGMAPDTVHPDHAPDFDARVMVTA